MKSVNKFLPLLLTLIIFSCKPIEHSKDTKLTKLINNKIAKGEIKPEVSYLNNSGINRWCCDSIIIDVVSESGYDNFSAHLIIGGEELHLTDKENESIINTLLIEKEKLKK